MAFGQSGIVRMERVAGWFILLYGWRRALVAFLAGALLVLAQAPFDFPAVGFAAFPILVWLIDGATGDAPRGLFGRLRPAFAVGWWFGFGYFVGGLWWIGNALLVEADSFAWALPLAVLALPAGLAIFYGLATALARLFWAGTLTRILALAAAFGAAEWLRGIAFTGFPWNAIGYAAMPVPALMQSASLIGLAGMNVLAVLVFAMPAVLSAPRGSRSPAFGLVLAAVLLAAHVGYGVTRLGVADRKPADSKTISFRIVQPSIAQSIKWDAAERNRIFKTYLDLSKTPPAADTVKPSIVIWPETALPFLLTDRPDALSAFADMLDDGQTLLVGAVRAETGGGATPVRYSNAMVQINDRGEIVDAADKVHLVPFGEYLPFEEFLNGFGIQKIVDTPMSFSPGAGRRPLNVGTTRILPLICYEAIFPDEIAADAMAADVMINITNDAWYGDTPGPYQHFRQAQLRAAEFGRPLIRSGNNGISGAVDPYGRVVDALALDAVGALDVTVPLTRPVWRIAGNPGWRGLAVLAMVAVFVVAGNLRQWRRRR